MQATGSKEGYSDGQQISTAVEPVAPGVFELVQPPSITGGARVTTFLVNTELYEYNDGKARKPGEKNLDRHNDGVAGEKR